jgi:hypothetical protein
MLLFSNAKAKLYVGSQEEGSVETENRLWEQLRLGTHQLNLVKPEDRLYGYEETFTNKSGFGTEAGAGDFPGKARGLPWVYAPISLPPEGRFLLVRYEETFLLRFGIEAGANACLERPEACVFEVIIQFLGGGGRYTARAHAQPPPPPSEAARPALMSRAAHAVESKAVVRIEVAVSPRHYSVFLSCPLHPALFHPPGAGPTPGERSAQVSQAARVVCSVLV